MQKGFLVMPILFTLVGVFLFLAFVAIWFIGSNQFTDWGYKKEVKTSTIPEGFQFSPNQDLYGGLKMQRVSQYRMAAFPLNETDGGSSYTLSDKFVLTQVDKDKQEQNPLAQINLKPLDGTSRGNIIDSKINWLSDSKFEYKITNGFYGGKQDTQSGQLELQKLLPSASPSSSPKADINKSSVIYLCAGDKKIGASYLSQSVALVLSDGRQLELPQALSGSGARYTNADESFVFWNKGQTAFIEEKKDDKVEATYKDCLQK